MIKELDIEKFTLGGPGVSRKDLMQLIELPLKNKSLTSFVKDLQEEDYPDFIKLFVDNGQNYPVSKTS